MKERAREGLQKGKAARGPSVIDGRQDALDCFPVPLSTSNRRLVQFPSHLSSAVKRLSQYATTRFDTIDVSNSLRAHR